MYLKVESLCKEFGERIAVDNVSFEARPGSIVGLLGTAGAGKTTILRMLMDVIRPDSGQISYDANTLSLKIRDAIGYMPQQRGLCEAQSLFNTLVYFARLKNLGRKKARVEAVRLMDRFNVIDQMDAKIGQLTEEMRQKVEIMIAIIHNPDLLIFDEPFAGLHFNNLKLMRKLLKRLHDEGKTIVLATSQLDEAELVCDEVLMLTEGKVVLQASLNAIRNKFRDNIIHIQAREDLEPLQGIYGVKRSVIRKDSAYLFVDPKIAPQKILDVIVKSVNAQRIEVSRSGLSDIYTQLVYGKEKGVV